MQLNIAREVAALQRLSTNELRAKYAALFGEATRAGHKAWLVKRLAWRLQALAEGDLSERARRRAAELAHDADLRLSPPRPRKAAVAPAPKALASRPSRDCRLPLPGTVLTRRYKGQTLQVEVLPHGFAFTGQRYKSLGAVAKAITGSHYNGFYFFRLGVKGGDQ